MALPLTLDARSLGTLQGGWSGASRREKTRPPVSMFEEVGPLASINSGSARGLGTFLSEGMAVTIGMVPSIILGTALLQVEGPHWNVILKPSLTEEPHGLTPQHEAGTQGLSLQPAPTSRSREGSGAHSPDPDTFSNLHPRR